MQQDWNGASFVRTAGMAGNKKNGRYARFFLFLFDKRHSYKTVIFYCSIERIPKDFYEILCMADIDICIKKSYIFICTNRINTDKNRIL